METLNGYIAPQFEPVAEAVREQLQLGTEIGLSLAVDLDGVRVVDLRAGHRDAARTQPWTADTITNVWSITKTVTTLALLTLVDSGDVDLTAPVARYWPEFAANGKAEIEVRHLLSHTAGLPGLDQPVTLADLYDTRATADRLAASAPWWEPGRAAGYHVLTFGHLIGELIERVTGETLGKFVARHLAAPLGADFQLGLRDTDAARAAALVPPPAAGDLSGLDPTSVAYRTLTGPGVDPAVANTPAWRAAELGAANGHGNAVSVVDLLRPLALGGDTPAGRLLRPATIERILDPQSDGVDLVTGLHVRWGLGFALADPRTLPWLPSGRVAFWGGWGGSLVLVDLDRRLTVGYVMNNMGADVLGSARSAAYLDAIYQSVAVLAGRR